MAAPQQLPGWRVDDGTGVRVHLQAQLERGSIAFRKLLVPQSIEPSDNLNALLNKFNETTLNAFISLFYLINRTLFEEPETIIDRAGDSRRRYIVEYIDESRVAELATFIHDIFESPERSLPDQAAIISFFKVWLGDARSSVNPLRGSGTSSETATRSRWYDRMGEVSEQFDDLLRAGTAADTAEKAAKRATEAEAAAERAAGRTGALSLGKYFRDIATKEGWKAFGWTMTAFAGAGVVLWISKSIVYNSVNSKWVDALLHLIIVLPIIGAATYAGSLARHHRVVARWAKTAAVQVDSVEAFTKQLSSQDKRDEVILSLGRNVFSTPTYDDDIKGENLSAIPPALADALKDGLKEIAKKLPPRDP